MFRAAVAWTLLAILCLQAHALEVMDLAVTPTAENSLERVRGSAGVGSRGVPVAGGADVDGDGFGDVAIAHFNSSPLGRTIAGQVILVFGDGVISGEFDTAGFSPDHLRIAGVGLQEAAGSEIWMDDVTGDGIGDLLICRQNYTPEPGREGAGGLTILVGGPEVRAFASRETWLDLGAPPQELTLVTISGRSQFDRLGIWIRTGDIDGDAIADMVIGADQVDVKGDNSGMALVVRGGPHLLASPEIHLDEIGHTPIEGHLARVFPPDNSNNFHLGATCQIADLDGDGLGEVLAAATLNRSGAGIAHPLAGNQSQPSGGALDGRMYIAWDENFPSTLWPVSYEFTITASPASHTVIRGAPYNRNFGEEMVGGGDFDGDGALDLFVGDLTGDATSVVGAPSRTVSGVGHVIYGVEALRGMDVHIHQLPEGVRTSTFVGPSVGAIGGDTAAVDDYNGDGYADLAMGNPSDDIFGRNGAGTIHLFFGRPGGWPEALDLRYDSLIFQDVPYLLLIAGANGSSGGNQGDMLCYSASRGDVDGDGTPDIVVNEMTGDGTAPGTEDVGNIIIISGKHFLDELGLLLL